MLEILQFIFGSFWRFVGTIVLIALVGQIAIYVAAAAKGR